MLDLVLTFNRWNYRTIIYTALMRHEDPPFRLDHGPGKQERAGANAVDLSRPPS